jgi:ribosomal-protein-alanine N-acetyltransferase
VTRAWPAVLADGPVGLRPIRQRDAAAWRAVRRRNVEWLRPWEATVPVPGEEPAPTFSLMVRRLRTEARERRTLPWVVTYDGQLAGQLTVGGISWGSLRSAHIGYWVDQAVAGRGVMPTAVALAVDHCFDALALHRVEVNIRPENTASRRVVEKLGFRYEGVRPRYLHIDGDWRDHLSYALLADEVPGGLLSRWHRSRAAIRTDSSGSTA